MSSEREHDHYQIDVNYVSLSVSAFETRQRVDIGVIGVMDATIDIPDKYDANVPPPPEKQASDLVYYKSSTYQSDED